MAGERGEGRSVPVLRGAAAAAGAGGAAGLHVIGAVARAGRQPGCRAMLVGLVGGTALGVGLRLLLFVVGALVVRALALVAAPLVTLLPSADPVYTRAALWSLSELRLQGLALGGLGLVRLQVEPGTPVLARLLAAGFAHAGVLGLGLLLVRAGWLRRRPLFLVAGLAVQVQVALGVIGEQPSLRELEATGLAFAANALVPWLSPRGGTP